MKFEGSTEDSSAASRHFHEPRSHISAGHQNGRYLRGLLLREIKISMPYLRTYEVRLLSQFCEDPYPETSLNSISCSLGCTQSHKIYCTPKPQEQTPSINDNPSQPETDADDVTSKKQKDDRPDPAAVVKSPDLEPLLNRYPQLRAQLRDMYKTTLEEEWVEYQYQPQAGRGRANARGGRGGYRNRGPWTHEKGFNRGLGKVRKYRERCEAGLEIGKNAEGFMRFVALVNGSGNGDDSSLSREPA